MTDIVYFCAVYVDVSVLEC